MALTTYPTVTMTTGGAHTKGAYAEIVASTPYASSRLHLQIRTSGLTSRMFLCDLATGAAGAESVIVANLALNCQSAETIIAALVAIDVDIPAGRRIAVRAQSNAVSQTLSCVLLLEDRAVGGLTNPVTYGSFTNTVGTLLDPGGTINTKGSYVEYSASTSARIDALAICVTPSQPALAIASFTTWRVDIATGAGGAETVVIPDVVVQATSAADSTCPAITRLPVSIPAGTRVAVRCDCTRNTAVERLLAVTLIGMQEPATGGGAAGAVAYVG